MVVVTIFCRLSCYSPIVLAAGWRFREIIVDESPLQPNRITDAVIVDIDNDGRLDLWYSGRAIKANERWFAWYRNTGNMQKWQRCTPFLGSSIGATWGDVDGDGDLDIVSAAWDNYKYLHLWRNDAVTTNTKTGRINWMHLSNLKGDLPRANVGRQAASLILDIDKDGVNDFVIAGWSEETSMVWFRRTREGWDRYLIDNRKSHIEAGGTYWDIDGDVVSLSGPGEWLYFADPGVNRSLFLIYHEDDEAIDSYWPMNQEMTVFGFGRKGLNKFMRTVPTQFTIGLCDECSFAKVSKVVNSAYRDLVIHIGHVQAQNDVESVSACNMRKARKGEDEHG